MQVRLLPPVPKIIWNNEYVRDIIIGRQLDDSARKGNCLGVKAMEIVCAWCGSKIGEKEGHGITHGICQECHDREELRIMVLMESKIEDRPRENRSL
jgi:hypothetical protein